MANKWYEKATVQSALVNAIPNILIAFIAIISIIVTFYNYKHESSQIQVNFEKQITRDSVVNVQQDSVTKQNLKLAELQLELTKKQYTNDSMINKSELLIADKQYRLLEKENHEGDILIKENLFVDKISLQAFDTKYNEGFIDSIVGFAPDITYKINSNTVGSHFLMLECLSLFDFKNDSLLNNSPNFFTVKDAQEYVVKRKVQQNFEISKKFTILIDLFNNTKFPIKSLNTNHSYCKIIDLTTDSSFESPLLFENNKILYPNQKITIPVEFYTSLDFTLNKSFSLYFSFDYITIYGKGNKRVKAKFFPEYKSFVIFD